MSEAARSRRDEARYEPTLAVPGRDPAARQPESSDPLAELARLVGQDDPYRSVFRPVPVAKGAPQTVRQAPFQPQDEPRPDLPHADHGYGGVDHDAASWAADGGHEADLVRHTHDDDAYDAGYAERDVHAGGADHHPVADHHPAARNDGYYAPPLAQLDEAGMADATAGYDAAALPDVWARGDGVTAGSAPDPGHGSAPAGHAPAMSSARRPAAVLAAVLLLTGGGLAATFLAKGTSAPGAASATAGRAAPTILAATGPTKVKADDGSATAPEDQDAALLNKNGNVSSGPVKIVSSQEQPADLGQLPKSDLAEGARPLPQPSSTSPFPEPKKVKTFLVHPDGTMLSGAPAPSEAPADPAAASALPATPKTAARGGMTPKSPAPPPTIASLSTDAAPADPAEAPAPAPAPKAGRQPAAPGLGHQAPAKPNDTADAPASGGRYGAQLASLPTEADANAAFAKLKKKYPAQLGAYTATVHKAETGDKPVYRVRVGGMSQDEAKALCSQLQSAGGSCLVMHN